MKWVSDILDAKGREVHSVGPESTVFDALRVMSDQGIGAVLVIDNDHLVGIFTERDYARKVVLLGRSSRDLPVREIMTRKVLCVSPERTVEECMALCTAQRARHLPVVEHKQVVGIVSIGDLVKAVIAEQQHLIEELQQYISGGG